MPPRMAAAKSGSSKFHPISGRNCESMPSKMPAVAAIAAPIAHVQTIIRSVFIPLIRAKSGLSAVARSAWPIFECFRKRYSPTTMARQAIRMKI